MGHGIGKSDHMYAAMSLPWHGLGTFVGERELTSDEAIKAAELDWEVHPVEIFDGEGSQIPRFRGLRETKTGSVLTVVSDRYKPIQNREAFSFLDEVSESGTARIHTAGSLYDLHRVWVLARIKGNIKVVDEDEIEKFILFHMAHDGTGAVNILFTPVRVVCANTLTYALKGRRGRGPKEYSFKITHKGDTKEQLAIAKSALGLIDTNFNALEEAYQAMAVTDDVDLTKDYYREFLNKIHMPTRITDPDERKKMDARIDKQLQQLIEHQQRSTTVPQQDNPTLWTGYNVITEYFDHGPYAPSQATDRRMNSLLFGQRAAKKQLAQKMAMELADERA